MKIIINQTDWQPILNGFFPQNFAIDSFDRTSDLNEPGLQLTAIPTAQVVRLNYISINIIV